MTPQQWDFDSRSRQQGRFIIKRDKGMQVDSSVSIEESRSQERSASSRSEQSRLEIALVLHLHAMGLCDP
jgi:hypothetical protein